MNRIYNKFRRHIAEQVFESVTEPANTAYYVVISKSTAWANDAAPGTPTNTEHFADHTFHEEFISGKLIKQSDISYVVRRVNWISGSEIGRAHV